MDLSARAFEDPATDNPRIPAGFPTFGQFIAHDIPVEFADAAYRFGHPQIRATYQLNERAAGLTAFPDLAGTRPVPADRAVDWARFFALPGRPAPQASKRINARLVHVLIDLPESVVGETERPEQHSLAYRDP